MAFKPQTDVKPTFLIKDCTLPEFNKFTETFIAYMNSSGSTVPAEAIYSNLRVHMDDYWFKELIGVGLSTQTELTSFTRLMDEVSLVKFPLHNRRMTVFCAKQTGDAMAFLRELIENIRVADWATFNEEAAACHIFMNSTK